MKTLFFALFCCLIFPQVALADIIFSEIMYDPAGVDGGNEWVEVLNTSESSSVTLTGWKLLENATNHKINEFQGGGQVESGAYAVIADNPANFLLAYPGYTGILFDSAFSLNNTGETLALVDENTVTVDTVTYSADPGADGTGDTLQNIHDTWLVGHASPGRVNVVQDDSESDDTDSENSEDVDLDSNNNTNNDYGDENTTTISLTPTKILPKYFEPYYKGMFELPKRVVSGVAASYAVDIVRKEHLKKDTHKNSGYFVWNMGDGNRYEREWNDPIQHIYQYPGNYVIVLDWHSGKGTFESEPDITLEKNIRVYAPDIRIEGYNDDGAIGVRNATKFTFDISGWLLGQDKNSFNIPAKTYLPAGEVRYFPTLLTGFNSVISTTLSYPNGKVLHLYDPHAVAITDEQKNEDLERGDEESTEELGLKDAANSLEGPVQTEVLASALFSQPERTGNVFESIPWWIWLIVGISLIASILSILIARGVFSFITFLPDEPNDSQEE